MGIASTPESLTGLTHGDMPKPPRLTSLDAFRGVVIVAMLIVNNLGDFATTGYFWKHAGFVPATQGYASVQFGAFATWWEQVRSVEAPITHAFTQLPIWKHCTLADFVMPMFMLIIGLAMPFSVASSCAKGTHPVLIWLRVLKRAAMLVLLGWILCYFRDQFAAWWRDDTGQVKFRIVCGMDVLQLLGVGYLVSRVLYALPAYPRLCVSVLLLLWHWAVLRFWPQGEIPRGTFTHANNAIGYIYARDWWIWRSYEPFAWLSINWKGLMSVPPAVAMMLLGTLMGDWLRREDVEASRRVKSLALYGALAAAIGFLWAFDLPFNKDRWTSCYILWCAGVGAMTIAVIYVIVDIHQVRGWTYPFIVLGANAIAAYFITILAKVLLLNTPRVNDASRASLLTIHYGTAAFLTVTFAWAGWLLIRAARRQVGGVAWILWLAISLPLLVVWWRFSTTQITTAVQPTLLSITQAVTLSLKTSLGAWEGGWMFTIGFFLFWWLIFDQAYRRRIFWKL